MPFSFDPSFFLTTKDTKEKTENLRLRVAQSPAGQKPAPEPLLGGTRAGNGPRFNGINKSTEKFELENNSMHSAAGGSGLGTAGGSAAGRQPGSEH